MGGKYWTLFDTVGYPHHGAFPVSPGFHEQCRAVAFSAPEGFLDPFVWQRGHGEAGMRDAKPAFFIAHHLRGRIDGLALTLRRSHQPRRFEAVSQDQLVNIRHVRHLP